jgi:hypothetical protein
MFPKLVFGGLSKGAYAHKVAQMQRRRWVTFVQKIVNGSCERYDFKKRKGKR